MRIIFNNVFLERGLLKREFLGMRLEGESEMLMCRIGLIVKLFRASVIFAVDLRFF